MTVRTMPPSQEQLDATFAALADPTRRAIVAKLARGDATVNELAAPFEMTLPAISKHLKMLERCGLISRTRQAQFRPCHLERARPATSPPPPTPPTSARTTPPRTRPAPARPPRTTPARTRPARVSRCRLPSCCRPG